MPRRPQLNPKNDNLVFVRGLVDAADPTNADGSPKWINNATVAWEVRSSAPNPDGTYPGGSSVATGTAIPVGTGGAYRCELSSAIAILAENDYWLHVTITTQDGFVADLSDSFEAILRTGRTAVT
jgi:hypothetical protein